MTSQQLEERSQKLEARVATLETELAQVKQMLSGVLQQKIPCECAAIALAEELKANRLLMDERAGRKLAQTLALPTIGTIGILLLAKEERIVSEITPLLDDLIDQGT